jgi:hypothetical protein
LPKSKRKQGVFKKWNAYTTRPAFCFLKCPETIGGKKIHWVRWPSDWYTKKMGAGLFTFKNNPFTRVAQSCPY